MFNELKILVENIKDFRKRILNEGASVGSIEDAINNHKIIYIYYAGDETVQPGYRTIKPFVVGTHKRSGNPVVRAWQDAGNSDSYNNIKYHNWANKKRPEHEYHFDHKGRVKPGWRLFRIDKITSVMPTGETFKPENIINNPRGANYNPNDKEINVTAAIQPTADSAGGARSGIHEPTKPDSKSDKPSLDHQASKFKRFHKAHTWDRDIGAKEVKHLWDINQRVKKKSPRNMMVVQTEKGDMVLKDESQRHKYPADSIVGNLKDLYNKYVKPDIGPSVGDNFFIKANQKRQ